jgi:hypothetical protein
VVKDIGDGKIVLEGTDDEDDCGEKDCDECGDAGAARSFAEALRSSIVLEYERERSSAKTVKAQRESEEKCEATNFRHGKSLGIFSETARRGNG